MKKICILGLGHIGLPIAAILSTKGFKIVGVDINSKLIKKIRKGIIEKKEPGLESIVKSGLESGNLKVQGVPEPADVFIICVPTPLLNNQQNLNAIKNAIKSILSLLRKNNLVIVESTIPVGTTKNIVAPLLKKSGLKVGKNLFLAHCPERVLPGNILEELIKCNRIIAGINIASTKIAKTLYKNFVKGEIIETDTTTAEIVKLMENTYRDVNIALANELSVLTEKIGVDIYKAIDLANKHPRIDIHKPGPGVGGHCVGTSSYSISNILPNFSKLIRLARKINEERPKIIVQKVKKIVKNIPCPKIAILGVAYKGNINDTSNTPAIPIIKGLKKIGYKIKIHDPLVKIFDEDIVKLKDAVLKSDCILILAAHKQFTNINPNKIKGLMRHHYVIDSCNILDKTKWQNKGFKIT